MMPKISNGSTFGGIVNYANDIKDKDATILASRGVDLRSNYTIAKSFKIQAMMNPRVENCVGHFALSFPPEDAHRCTDGFMRKLAMEYMKKMGIVNTQFVIFRHHDHDHDHVHVVYNRVDDSGKTISDGCDVERAIAICQAMTRHYGLHWSEGKMNVNRDRLKGKAKVKYAIYDAAQKALTDTQTWPDFIKRMEEQGIQVKLAPRENGKGIGITFTMGDVSMSGTQVDRRTLTFGKLNKFLYNVNNVLPKEQLLPDEPQFNVVNFDDLESEVLLPKVTFDKSDEYVEDSSVNIYDSDSDSAFFDTDAIAETASNIGAAAVELMVGSTDVAPTLGGGGGSSSSGWGDDDDDEKKKNKRSSFHR